MKLGTKVEFINSLVRVKEAKKRKWIANIFKYNWIQDHNNFKKTPLRTNGIIIGVRTLQNGYVIYESVDDGYAKVFICEEMFKAYLVAVDLKRNPVYVLPKDLIINKPTK